MKNLTNKTYKTISSSGFVPKGQISKRLIAIVFVLVLACSVLTGTVVYVVYAQTDPAGTLYVEEGVYPGADAYTIWRENYTYYAKDGYGHIPTWGLSSNACYVINNAITELEDTGGSILLKAGRYQLSGYIDIKATYQNLDSRALTIKGETLSGDAYFTKLMSSDIPEGTVLEPSSGYTGSLIYIGDNATNQYLARNIEISYLTISGHSLPYVTEGVGSITQDSSDAGIRAYNVINCVFHHLTIINCYKAMYISTNGGTNDGVELHHIWVGYNRYGIWCDGSNQVLTLTHIYSYLNSGSGVYLSGQGVSIEDYFSNGDAEGLQGAPNAALTLMAAGYVRAHNIFIQNGINAVRAGIRGIIIYFLRNYSVVNVDNALIQAVDGIGIEIWDNAYKNCTVDLTHIYCPVGEQYLGGQGEITTYAIVSRVKTPNNNEVRLFEGDLRGGLWNGTYGNFTRIQDVLGETDYP